MLRPNDNPPRLGCNPLDKYRTPINNKTIETFTPLVLFLIEKIRE